MPLTEPEIRAAYGRRISAARADADLSQRQLADKLVALGLAASPQAVSRWEQGKVAPRLATQRALVELFGADLFNLDDEAA